MAKFGPFVLPLMAVIAFLAALALRLPGLNDRPFHVDEANNAFILQETLQGGFHYRTKDHHGPTLFWLAEGPMTIAGIHFVSEMEPWMLRLATVICSAGSAAAVFLLVPFISPSAAQGSAFFLLLAAPFHYYGRTFIHESLLLFLTILWLALLFRMREKTGFIWPCLAGLLLGAMILTKENAAVTALLILFAFVWAGREFYRGIRWKLGLMVLSGALIVVSVLGLDNIRLALFSQFERGLSSGHEGPWWQYMKWFVSPSGPGLPWSSWLALPLAAVALFRWKEQPLVLPLGLGFFLLFGFHSLLPYKTPWLILGPGLFLVLLAGLGAAKLMEEMDIKKVLALAFLGAALLFSETWKRSFHNEVNPANPLAYAPTDPQAYELVKKIDGIALTHPLGRELVLQVVGPDYWPLPWLLRHYPRTGFWNEIPAEWPGDLLICSAEGFGWVPEPRRWDFSPYAIRPGVIVFLGVPSGVGDK